MKHDIMISSKGNSKNPDPLDKLFENLDFTPNQNHVIIDIGKNLIYCKGGEKVVNEEMAVFKGYLRSLMRQLKLLKKAINEKNIEEAEKLINELIEDTQNNIED